MNRNCENEGFEILTVWIIRLLKCASFVGAYRKPSFPLVKLAFAFQLFHSLLQIEHEIHPRAAPM